MPPRLLVTKLCTRRAFSTTRASCSGAETVTLAFSRHDPPTPPSGTAASTPIVLMHGLFGSQRNNRTFSKVLAKSLARQVYLVDLRNHGESPHHPIHNYTALSADIEAFLHQHSLTTRQNVKPILIGHSMGAKAAMTLALRSASSYSGVVPIDNAPVDAALHSDFAKYVKGMQEVESVGVTKQSEADQILQKYEESLAIRQFLLTNLVKPTGGDSKELRWRVPLGILAKNLDRMADFPFHNPDEVRYEGPCLVIRGSESRYVADDMLPIFGRFFPRFELCDVQGAGHWVVSEKFNECVQAVVTWAAQWIDNDGDSSGA